MPFEVRFNIDRGKLQPPRTNGRFAGAEHPGGGMAEFNDKMIRRGEQQAQVLRQRAGELVRESLVRPGESTGQLERAHASVNNTFVSATQFGIGNTAWLDRATQKQGRYWRLIEQGTTQFVGRQITIVAKGARGGRNRPNDPGIRMVDRSVKRASFGKYNAPRDAGGRLKPGPRGNLVIRRPILPHDVYGKLNAQERDRITRVQLEQAREYFAALGIRTSRY